ncbi:MAG TPA: hypothetical protein VER55_11090 [Ardenticatenaceae bacterium]|nr:hypothetical protein [Ardenticatenaceae bacterium]
MPQFHAVSVLTRDAIGSRRRDTVPMTVAEMAGKKLPECWIIALNSDCVPRKLNLHGFDHR